ncbi:polysaccharide biosynthesis tyrosine autokinase [Desulfonema magnum]|uniref:polysaccharide biosynthesis tyrosine autokinase n=1 Tax=Desulfonema magnum TaxID=45655 RepID=UPI001FEB6542|nr:polysaccharide biosynthesis tyrosine autokinase [Desulfonema magnum]
MGTIFALRKTNKTEIIPVSAYEDSAKKLQYEPKEQETPPETSAASYKESELDKNMVMLLKPRSFEAEQFRVLRTNLLFPTLRDPPRSIMVTSATPGEGKSFVSANLAISIAQNVDNKYALLMDCDMHRPCLHNRFGFGDKPGLSEHLSSDVPLSSLFLKTKVKRLTILPGGKPPHNPSELLSSEKMSALLKEVQSRYNDRYTVIDSPPPKLTAETNVIAKQVDGVVLVVKYGVTPRKLVAELIEIIGKDRILGIITNWADTSTTYRMYRKHIRRK